MNGTNLIPTYIHAITWAFACGRATTGSYMGKSCIIWIPPVAVAT